MNNNIAYTTQLGFTQILDEQQERKVRNNNDYFMQHNLFEITFQQFNNKIIEFVETLIFEIIGYREIILFS